MFTGRAVPPGEPQFTAEDTDAAIALAEEEAETCPQCGWPRSWCRDPANQFAFDVDESVCWPSYRLAQEHNKDDWKAKGEHGQRATQLSVRFREGHEPDLLAGLDLAADGAD